MQVAYKRALTQASECSRQEGEGRAGLRHIHHQHGQGCAGTYMYAAGRLLPVAAKEDMVVGKGEDGCSGEIKPWQWESKGGRQLTSEVRTGAHERTRVR